VNPIQPTSAEASKTTPALPSINWVVFLVVLLTPALLTILVVLSGGRDSGAAPAIAFLGGGIAGIICGAMLGRRLGRTTPLKIVLGLVFAMVLSVVCIGMSCFGCLASGFHLDFR
jgi:CDP-diglyceride synthetase